MPSPLEARPQGSSRVVAITIQKRLVRRSWSQILFDDIYSFISASGSRLACLGKLHG